MKECVQQKGPTFMTYDRSWSCQKADNARHIVISQDVHCHSVRAGQNSASTFSVHQTHEDIFIIFGLRVIQNCQNSCLFGFTYEQLMELIVKVVK